MGILRLLLALSIVIVHSNGIVGHRVAGAGAGIQAFCLISGFYMALVLNSKYKSLSWTTFDLEPRAAILEYFPYTSKKSRM